MEDLQGKKTVLVLSVLINQESTRETTGKVIYFRVDPFTIHIIYINLDQYAIRLPKAELKNIDATIP